MIIYTDASCPDEYAGIGAVSTEVENDQRYISAAPIDKALRRVLAPNCAAPINCLELLAVLCTMISSRDVIRSRTRGRTKTHTEILESVKVDQQSNQPPPFRHRQLGTVRTPKPHAPQWRISAQSDFALQTAFARCPASLGSVTG